MLICSEFNLKGMKTILLKLFSLFLSIIGIDKSKKLLWTSLQSVIRKTYPLTDGGGEYPSWMQIKNNFKAPTIIDVGANLGKVSKQFLKIFPDAKIFAVEPIPEFFEQIDDSKLVGKFNLALSNNKKTLTLYQSGNGSKPFPKNTKSKKNDVINIRAIKGDDFVKEAQTGQVDIIKIDTEGFDFEVLQGFIKVIKKDKPFIQFELSKWWLPMGYTIKQAQMLFEELDYDLYRMTDDGLIPLKINLPDSLFITLNILAVSKYKDLSF